jgi:hypothetical protein
VPESKGRKKSAYTPPTTGSLAPAPSPRWFAPVMIGFFLLGLLYIVTFYLTSGEFPIRQFGTWNIVVGFGVIMAGFGMATRWR